MAYRRKSLFRLWFQRDKTLWPSDPGNAAAERCGDWNLELPSSTTARKQVAKWEWCVAFETPKPTSSYILPPARSHPVNLPKMTCRGLNIQMTKTPGEMLTGKHRKGPVRVLSGALPDSCSSSGLCQRSKEENMEGLKTEH